MFRTVLVAALLLLAAAFLVFRLVVRRDYLRKGRLTLFAYALQLLIWGLFFTFPYLYNPRNWFRLWPADPPWGIGVQVLALVSLFTGLLLVVYSMGYLGWSRSNGRDTDVLKQLGPYRVSRNPQVVGGAPLIVGLALVWPSWYAVGWVALFLAMAHIMVRTEEEHLRAKHGGDYEAYCKSIPRYLPLPRRPRRTERSQ
jgi:protein-S-isoprenylcysteine O-methyltransferase Ste14